ncbi:MAG: NfeD family protein [Bacteroidia bacterium]|nr:NfeD family protein [Bacteroidia bacterium]NNC86790.1 NfeD family protein [Bacteroidia bacterium]NNM15852.1 NfeD family protein [Bacteroidia bacterium]
MWATIITLILVGIVLIILEIILIPGFIAGIIGALSVLAGIYLSYSEFDSTTGNIVAASSVALTLVAIILTFRMRTWDKIGLQDEMKWSVPGTEKLDINEGDVGETISALRPMGTVMINDKTFEAESTGDLIDENTKVKVLKILTNKVIVETLN